jgi:hypothetical protein
VTRRPTASDITDDQLDALYYRLSQARTAVGLHRKGLVTTAELYAVIEADSEPVATEATDLPAHNSGPTVAECRDHDRAHWNDKYDRP